jgi:hypothetical protein
MRSEADDGPPGAFFVGAGFPDGDEFRVNPRR